MEIEMRRNLGWRNFLRFPRIHGRARMLNLFLHKQPHTSTQLATLPAPALDSIARNLEYHDVLNLSLTCAHIRSVLSPLLRRTVILVNDCFFSEDLLILELRDEHTTWVFKSTEFAWDPSATSQLMAVLANCRIDTLTFDMDAESAEQFNTTASLFFDHILPRLTPLAEVFCFQRIIWDTTFLARLAEEGQGSKRGFYLKFCPYSLGETSTPAVQAMITALSTCPWEHITIDARDFAGDDVAPLSRHELILLSSNPTLQSLTVKFFTLNMQAVNRLLELARQGGNLNCIRIYLRRRPDDLIQLLNGPGRRHTNSYFRYEFIGLPGLFPASVKFVRARVNDRESLDPVARTDLTDYPEIFSLNHAALATYPVTIIEMLINK